MKLVLVGLFWLIEIDLYADTVDSYPYNTKVNTSGYNLDTSYLHVYIYVCHSKNVPNKHRPGWHLTSYSLGQERLARSWWSHQPQRDQGFHGGKHRKPKQPKIGYVPTHEAHRELLNQKFGEISSLSAKKKTTAKNP